VASVIRGDDNFDTASPGMASWTSGDLAYVHNGTYTISHPLGVIPKAIQIEVVCYFAIHGYSLGDVLTIGQGISDYEEQRGVQIVAMTDSTLKYGVYSAGLMFRAFDSTSVYSRAVSRWRLRFTLIG